MTTAVCHAQSIPPQYSLCIWSPPPRHTYFPNALGDVLVWAGVLLCSCFFCGAPSRSALRAESRRAWIGASPRGGKGVDGVQRMALCSGALSVAVLESHRKPRAGQRDGAQGSASPEHALCGTREWTDMRHGLIASTRRMPAGPTGPHDRPPCVSFSGGRGLRPPLHVGPPSRSFPAAPLEARTCQTVEIRP